MSDTQYVDTDDGAYPDHEDDRLKARLELDRYVRLYIGFTASEDSGDEEVYLDTVERLRVVCDDVLNT